MPRILAVVLLVASLAGCVGQGETGGGAYEPREGPASEASPVRGVMTHTQKTEKRIGPCSPPSTGIQITQPPPGPFCASSYLWAEGEIGLRELPLIMRTINGQVNLEFSGGPGWNLTIVASATNKGTQDQARQTIENLQIDWSHEEDGGHFLRVLARPKTTNCNQNCPRITITLQLPDNIFVRAELGSTSGDVVAGGHQYPHLKAVTTNGDAILKDSITRDVVLVTTNGNVDMRSRPYMSGSWSLSTTNGAIAVRVPEEATMGYDVTASTTNGDASITLQDGPAASGPRTSKSFETTDYDSRTIQTRMTARSTNGGVSVGRL